MIKNNKFHIKITDVSFECKCFMSGYPQLFQEGDRVTEFILTENCLKNY